MELDMISVLSTNLSRRSSNGKEVQTTQIIDEGYQSWMNVFAFLGIVSFTIPSVVFNAIVAITIACTKKFRSEATYMAMFVLALVDIGHCYVAFYPIGGSIITGEFQPDYEHRLIAFNIIYVFWYMTCISYGTIAINRFLAVVYPKLNKKVFSKRNMLWFLCSWPLFSVICMVPIIMGGCCPLDFTPKLWLLRYEEGREEEFNIQLIVCYVTSATATGIGIISYTAILIKIRRAAHYMAADSDQSRRLKKTDVNLSIQFFLLTAVFTFTWIVIHYEASLGPEKSHRLVNYLGLVGYAAMSGVNPFVYFTMNKSLRRAARKVLLRYPFSGPISITNFTTTHGVMMGKSPPAYGIIENKAFSSNLTNNSSSKRKISAESMKNPLDKAHVPDTIPEEQIPFLQKTIELNKTAI